MCGTSSVGDFHQATNKWTKEIPSDGISGYGSSALQGVARPLQRISTFRMRIPYGHPAVLVQVTPNRIVKASIALGGDVPKTCDTTLAYECRDGHLRIYNDDNHEHSFEVTILYR